MPPVSPQNDLIPDEALARIFSLAMGSNIAQCETRTNIGLVCKRWRKALLTSKFLWSKISLYLEEKHVYYECPHPTMSDTSYLPRCLALSHRHPLQISIRVDPKDRAFYGPKRLEIMLEAIIRLHQHRLNYRSLLIDAPTWFFDLWPVQLIIQQLHWAHRLEELTLIVSPEYKRPSGYVSDLPKVIEAAVKASVSLRHLTMNTTFPNIHIAWSSLTSLTSGFNTYARLYDVLRHMDTLHVLHITHIAGSDADAVRMITLSSLRHLKLTPCAICGISCIAAKLQVPVLTELSFHQQETYFNHRIGACPVDNITTAMADEYISMLHSSKARVGALNLSLECIDSPFFERLFSSLGATVQTLRVNLSSLFKSSVEAFLNQLIVANSAAALFPVLRTLDLVGNAFALYDGAGLEKIINSRWYCDDDYKLRTFRLYSKRSYDPESGDEKEYEPLVASSLSLALLQYRSEGLDAEWLDGCQEVDPDDPEYMVIDILEETRCLMPTVF